MPRHGLMRAWISVVLASLLALSCAGRSQHAGPGDGGQGGPTPASRGKPHVTLVGSSLYRVHADGTSGLVLTGSHDEEAGIVRLSASGAIDWSLALETGAYYLGLEGSAIDDEGNIYAAGAFSGTFVAPGQTLESVVNPGTAVDFDDPRGKASLDVYLLKLDRRGQRVWLKQFGGVADQQVLGLARAPDGTLGLAVSFTGRIDFDGQVFLSSGGATVPDLLLARLDGEGNLLHARAFPVPLGRMAAVAFDHAGSLYLGGEAYDASHFASLAVLPDAGYLMKLDTNFEPLWLIATDDQDGPDVRGIAFDSQDSVVIATDAHDSKRQFGVDVGEHGIGFAKLDTDGYLLFSRSFGQDRLDHASAVAVLSDDTIAVTGSFYQTVDFGGGELVPLEPHSSRSTTWASDTFAARFDAGGGYLGSLQLGALDADWAYGMIALPNDGVVVTGFSTNGITLGDATTVGSGNTYVASLGDSL
jgi:hypothetical protein